MEPYFKPFWISTEIDWPDKLKLIYITYAEGKIILRAETITYVNRCQRQLFRITSVLPTRGYYVILFRIVLRDIISRANHKLRFMFYGGIYYPMYNI